MSLNYNIRRNGWGEEERAAKTLEQLGPYVSSLEFVHVYQEILSRLISYLKRGVSDCRRRHTARLEI